MSHQPPDLSIPASPVTRTTQSAAVTATLGLALAVTGCSSNSGNGNATTPADTATTAAPADTTAATEAAPSDNAPDTNMSATLTYAFWDQTQQAGIESEIAAFNKIYPNIKVNLDVTPWGDYWTKVQTEASSNTLPDLFWMKRQAGADHRLR